MIRLLRSLLLLTFIAFWGTAVCWGGSNQTATFYSKMTATATPAGAGKVYVSANEESGTQQYQAESTATFQREDEGTKSAPPSSAQHSYFLYAQPEDGYTFNRWLLDGKDFDGNTANPCKVTKTVTSTDSSAPTSFAYVAEFIEKPALLAATNVVGTSTVVTPAVNNIGDVVTVSTKVQRISIASNISVPNFNLRFSHWADEEGNIVSEQQEFQHKIEKQQTLTANYIKVTEMPKNGRYYRVHSILGRHLKLEGNYSITIGTGTQVEKTLLRWALAEDYPMADYTLGGISSDGKVFRGSDDGAYDEEIRPYSDKNFTGKLGWDIYSDPGTIFYIEGTEGNNSLTTSAFSSQGVKTSEIMKNQYLNINMCDQSAFPGFQYVTSSSASVAGIKANTPWDSNNPTNSTQAALRVYIGKGDAKDYTSAVAFEPLDEEHIDFNWFGATASEEMEFDGCFWMSMYTAFPYRCYENDDIEAYYVKESYRDTEGKSYVTLCKIESGIVPAGEGVLLRCGHAESSIKSRLIPLSPSTPVDALEGNLLTGVAQLYTNTSGAGHKTFDQSTMRVFGVNNSGEVGFYKLSGNVELTSNRAYLDLTKLPSDRKAVSFKLSTDSSDLNGIEEIIEDNPAVNFEDSIIYDLNGRLVKTPVKGNIYIVDGKKMIW